MKNFKQNRTFNKISRAINTIVLMTIIFVGITAVFPLQKTDAASSAAIAVYLTTYCPSGQTPVGMWYHGAFSGNQGWARLNSVNANKAVYSFAIYSAIDQVSLSIGCGGTPANWGSTRTASVTVKYSPIESATVSCPVNGSYPNIYPSCVVYNVYNGYRIL